MKTECHGCISRSDVDQKKAHFLIFSQSNSSPSRRDFLFNGLHDTRKRIRFSCSITVFCIRFILRNIQFLYSHPSCLTFPTSTSSLFLFLQLQPRPLFVFLSAFHVLYLVSFRLFLILFLSPSAHVYQPLPFSQKTTRASLFCSFFFF